MTREEKISELIDNLIDNWSNINDFSQFVRTILYEGFEGYAHMSDDLINQEYDAVFNEEVI